ncbi:hypothetical protein Srubr_18110 [Streptomyces rubradiris]|uniref:Glycosyl hydrolase family 13 catalytic domain-containing protein n=1 Tax=Streptomyces rubradiris TaxID=285531 RepID=A0ABQ3R7Z1_STRRR|nr:hypothetical protein Srubr_18110 [Streptomyces rubradiris]
MQGTGSNASAGYHGYWITDFTQVDPHFGTDQDLKNLISKAHAKGMKVFFDVITNHTADVVDYDEKTYDYLSKGAFPYLTEDGRPFDDADHADGTGKFPPVGTGSFPHTPRATSQAKVPAWLNDPAMYHNRGDSTYTGESTTYGDFSGLDDLWTERPEVVRGMERIYQRWVRDFAVDGFRIDTVKHVNMEFWTQWATALDRYAAERGRKDFFMFGEVYSADPAVTAPYVTRGRLDATLDFPFQDAARAYASQGGSARKLAAVFGADHKYTTDKANAYEQVTFLGNHDMGRIGTFLKQDNPNATDAEILAKDRLANELMFLSRGNPVVYYGDEQGFTGSGGDKDARQTMFASKVADYLDDDEIGTDRTHASAAYDTGAPLYRRIADLARLRKAEPALTGCRPSGTRPTARDLRLHPHRRRVRPGVRRGLQQRRLGADGDLRDRVAGHDVPGDPRRHRPGALRRRPAAHRHRPGRVRRRLQGGRKARRAHRRAHDHPDRPGRRSHRNGRPQGRRRWGTAQPGRLRRPGRQREVADARLRRPRPLPGHPDPRHRRARRDRPALQGRRHRLGGHTASATASSTTGTPPAPEVPRASWDYAIVHYKRPDGDYDGWGLYAWGDLADGEATTWPAGHPFIGRDAYGAFAYVKLRPGASNVGFLVVDKDGNKDISADRFIDVTRTGEVWIEQGEADVRTERPDHPAQDPAKAVLHYHRADGDYDGWGLHVWTGAAHPTDWSRPLEPVKTDAYGAVFEVPLTAGATSLGYIIHKGDEKDLPADRSLDLTADGHEVWLVSGQEKHLLPQPAGTAAALDLTTAEAVWIDRDTVAWNGVAGAASTQLLYSLDGSLTVRDGTLSSDDERWIRLGKTALTDAQKAKFPT